MRILLNVTKRTISITILPKFVTKWVFFIFIKKNSLSSSNLKVADDRLLTVRFYSIENTKRECLEREINILSLFIYFAFAQRNRYS